MKVSKKATPKKEVALKYPDNRSVLNTYDPKSSNNTFSSGTPRLYSIF